MMQGNGRCLHLCVKLGSVASLPRGLMPAPALFALLALASLASFAALAALAALLALLATFATTWGGN